MGTKIGQQVGVLLEKEVERQDFLKLCGLAVLAAVGASGVIRALTAGEPRKQAKAPTAQPGTYGGKDRGA